MLSIFNMLNLGIVALDKEGLISSINQAALKLSGKRKISGKKWNRVLPFQKEDFPRIETMLRRAAPKRKKIEAKFGIPGKKGIWLEVEINDDPRDPDRKIMALYDMSEVYDLRHLLEKRLNSRISSEKASRCRRSMPESRKSPAWIGPY